MAKSYKTLEDLDLKNKTVLIRANLNVPIENGEIIDDTLIKNLIPTLQYLIKHTCKVVILSHLGEPHGEYIDELSLMPIRFELGRQLQKQIKFANVKQSENSIKFMEFGDILLLENLFFNPEETSTVEKTRKDFVKKFANLCDYYVLDYLTIDQKFATVNELPKLIDTFPGQTIIKELEIIKRVKESNTTYLFGNGDLSDKVNLINELLKETVKIILIGEIGTLFRSVLEKTPARPEEGGEISSGKEYSEINKTIKSILKSLPKAKATIEIPDKFITEKGEAAINKIKKLSDVQDIGSDYLKTVLDSLEKSNTVFWDGTAGENSSEKIGEYLCLISPKDLYKCINGTTTIKFVAKLKIKHKKINHIFSGNNATLALLASQKIKLLNKLGI